MEHITIFNSKYEPIPGGGAQRSVKLLADGLGDRGCRVRVVTLRPARWHRVRDPVARGLARGGTTPSPRGGVAVTRMPLANLYWPFSDRRVSLPVLRVFWHLLDAWNPVMFVRVLLELARHRPTVVHTNNLAGFSTAVWTAARLLGLPVVHTVRDRYLIAPSDRMQGTLLARILRARVRRRSRRVDHMVYISRFMADTHGRGFGPGGAARRTVIYNAAFGEQSGGRGAGTPGSVREGAAPSSARAPARAAIRIGYLGKLEDVKGVDRLIAAWRRLVADDASWPDRARLVVAGSLGSAADAVRRELRAGMPRGSELVGWVDGRSFLSGLDLLVVPSVWDEPMGRVVVESLATGVPVLVSDRGALPELVRDGEDGLVCPPTAADLATVLRRVVTDTSLRDRLHAGARSRDAAAFSLQRMVAAYARVFHITCRTAGMR